ncbi:MAG: ABC transporter permease [Prolixibacteraceae bacterium]|nr:ABC transporter permease [Prolixibacteraceae bacterium]
MKKQFFYSSIRTALKNKRSFAINVIGLSVGFAVLISIIFFIREELNYNQFHENIDDIYCVFTYDQAVKEGLGWNQSVPAMAEALRTEYPEVKDAALVYNGTLRMLFDNEGKKMFEQVQLTDPNLFNIFSFPISNGNIPQNTNETKIIALSREYAEKYFGKQNPVGKSIKINNDDLFTIVAVFDDIPDNSSLNFDVWMPIQLIEELYGEGHLDTWYNLSFQNYVLLSDNVDLEKLNKSLLKRIQQSNPGSREQSYLYPFKNLYLQAWGHKKNVKMMGMIAFVILSLVCLNFINLQSAEAFVRIRNIGVKKISGATNSIIFTQLIFEALFLCTISIFIAIGITLASSSFLFQLLGKPLTGGSMINVYSIIIVLLVAVIISVLSGLIPGLAIKNVSPVNAIRNNIKEQISVKKLRVVFTTLQFAMAIILIICLLTTNKQLSYLRNKNLGFNKDQLVYVHLEGDLTEKRDILREELCRNTSIINATCASRSPIGIYWNGGGWEWEGKEAEFDPQITYIETDDHFQETFEIKMAEGNYFESEIPRVVINETFAHMISPNGSALNKHLLYPEDELKVQVGGIIKDIHFKPLNREITPLMFIPEMGYDEMKYIFIKLAPGNIDNTLKFIEKTVTSLNPGFPYEHFFLDNDFARLYKGEQQLRNQMVFFSVMAIFISCMGLWAMLVFMVKQRTKEIGVRKVNGAKISEVMATLNKDILIWILFAFMAAIPIAWYIMHNWLQNFAYKTALNWWLFALAGVIALGIALLTVSWQSWRAATRNPVEALRYE